VLAGFKVKSAVDTVNIATVFAESDALTMIGCAPSLYLKIPKFWEAKLKSDILLPFQAFPTPVDKALANQSVVFNLCIFTSIVIESESSSAAYPQLVIPF
jgi:hypothetical protein